MMLSSKTKTRSWLSILTHDTPNLPPAAADSYPVSGQENPSMINPSSPLDSVTVPTASSNASPSALPTTSPSIPHVNINAAAPCKPVGRLARRPIGDNSYYRSDADLERDRAQRQAYRDWVAMNEMAKREMAENRESLPTISLKRVDPPVGEQLDTPLYLKPGEVTATTVFYQQNYGAVDLEGEDYVIYMNSKRKWERSHRARACSMCGNRDLGVALETYGCLLGQLPPL